MGQTPETYLGSKRTVGRAYVSTPAEIPNDQFALFGDWHIGEEYARPSQGAKLFFNYYAKDVYLVMRTNDGEVGKVKVGDKIIEVKDDKLYQLVDFTEPKAQVLELDFLTPNIEVYAFTFG